MLAFTPPTPVEAHQAAVLTVGQMADLFDSRYVLTPCVRRGRASRVCRARISGHLDLRVRVVVTRTPAGNFVVRSRRLQ